MKDRRLKISIAMATYNGASFLADQLNSLFAQTMQPDEVIIYDDASSDETLSLLMALRENARFKMEVISGTSNLQVNGSFSAALERCSGDIVFFCDQDDIWEPDKIFQMMKVFEDQPEVGMVFCDVSQIDERGQPFEQSLWEAVGFTKRRKRHFNRDCISAMLRGGNFIYGMASAFRAEIIQQYCPVKACPQAMTHDTWFALHTVATGWRAVALENRLVRYRRHDSQTTKEQNLSMLAQKDVRLSARKTQSLALIDALVQIRDNVSTARTIHSEQVREKALSQLVSKIDHLTMRERLRDTRSPMLALRTAMSPGFWIYAKGPLSVLRDLSGQ